MTGGPSPFSQVGRTRASHRPTRIRLGGRVGRYMEGVVDKMEVKQDIKSRVEDTRRAFEEAARMTAELKDSGILLEINLGPNAQGRFALNHFKAYSAL